MIDIEKAQRVTFKPTLSGHPFRILGNNSFNSTVNEFAGKEGENLELAKPTLDSLFPDLDSSAVYEIFCNSIYVAKRELALSA